MDKLTKDLWDFHILHYLSTKDRLNLSQTCKYFSKYQLSKF